MSSSIILPGDEILIRQTAADFLGPEIASEIELSRPDQRGFSGLPIWFLHDPIRDKRYVLKGINREASLTHVAWQHAFTDHLRAQGLRWIPTVYPCLTDRGEAAKFRNTAVDSTGRHWQCLSWVPGVPLSRPSTPQTERVLLELRKIHRLGTSFPLLSKNTLPSGWSVRQKQLRTMAASGWPQASINAQPSSNTSIILHWLDDAADTFRAHSGCLTASRIAEKKLGVLPPHPILRDVWWGNVLFHGQSDKPEHFSGMIDFDATTIDTPIIDLARLVGSWHLVSGDPTATLFESWPDAFAAYELAAPLPKGYLEAVQIFHDTAVVCGLARWFEWLLQEGRSFPDMPSVQARILALRRALPGALDRLRRVGSNPHQS